MIIQIYNIDDAYYFISLPCKLPLPCMSLTADSELLLYMKLRDKILYPNIPLYAWWLFFYYFCEYRVIHYIDINDLTFSILNILSNILKHIHRIVLELHDYKEIVWPHIYQCWIDKENNRRPTKNQISIIIWCHPAY